MFNAANILEALKNYIHTRGGTSNAYNIAEAVNDLNSIPQSSGGGTVVNFNAQISSDNPDEFIVSADKTPSEVLIAALTGPVVGTFTCADIGLIMPFPIGNVVIRPNKSPAFWFNGVDDRGTPIYIVEAEWDNWIVNLQ